MGPRSEGAAARHRWQPVRVDSTAMRPQRIALALNSLSVSVQEQGDIWKATFRAN